MIEEKIPVAVLAESEKNPDFSHAEWVHPANADAQVLIMQTSLTLSGATIRQNNLTPEKLKKLEDQAIRALSAIREALALSIAK